MRGTPAEFSVGKLGTAYCFRCCRLVQCLHFAVHCQLQTADCSTLESGEGTEKPVALTPPGQIRGEIFVLLNKSRGVPASMLNIDIEKSHLVITLVITIYFEMFRGSWYQVFIPRTLFHCCMYT